MLDKKYGKRHMIKIKPQLPKHKQNYILDNKINEPHLLISLCGLWV